MGAAAETRLSHVVGGERSRLNKARKILAVLGAAVPAQAGTLLDIGTGSGWMAHHLAKAAGLSVVGVDVADQREVREGFIFRVVQGAALPFESGSFDLVVSNHVVEHVGDLDAQRLHFAEIARVLKRDGTVYFAVPNKWSLTEPHYRLPLLSWLPPEWASRYVRATKRGTWYDCRPLGPLEIRQLIREAGFVGEDRAAQALLEMIRIEWPAKAWLLPLLQPAVRHLGPLMGLLSPTQIFVLKRVGQGLAR
ncbi:MAG: methyltransferase domain-containing protein [Stagnimonas sp.]|nr:methyltransferase domain-containing protein [Stagnimonas sp.]